MGRHKSYDRDEVLQRAMRVFWEQGYHATSTRDLGEAMGVNVYSLYAEFGSKEGLYVAALERYDSQIFGGHFGPLEAETGGLDEVYAVLDFFGASARRPGSHLGCLLCNAGTELAPMPQRSREITEAYVSRLSQAFRLALGRAVDRGRLQADSPIDALSEHLTAAMLGIFVMLRAQIAEGPVRAAAEQAKAQLRALEIQACG